MTGSDTYSRQTQHYSRTRGLYENNNASREELDAARTGHEAAKAQVRSAGKEREIARLQLSYTKLKAPSDGSVAEVPVEVNENVQAGQPIALIVSEGQPEVRVAIPEVLIARINRGTRVDVTFGAIPGQTFTATVTEVGTAATGAATTFPVIARLQKADPRIRSGLAANVTFTFGSKGEKQRIAVPLQAVGENRQGRFVFTLERQKDERGRVRRRAVTVGESAPTTCEYLHPVRPGPCEGMEILTGLKDGDLVVTAGVKRLEDGQQVKLLTARKSN